MPLTSSSDRYSTRYGRVKLDARTVGCRGEVERPGAQLDPDNWPTVRAPSFTRPYLVEYRSDDDVSGLVEKLGVVAFQGRRARPLTIRLARDMDETNGSLRWLTRQCQAY